MNLKFAYQRPDGGVTIVGAAPKEHLERVLGPMTEEQYRAHVLERSIPKDAQNLTELPSGWEKDRTFRDAWALQGGRVDVDMPKAREIHRGFIRSQRAPLLEKLDIEYQRADERGDLEAKAAIAARKQALRDATADPAIDAAVTPEELKAVIPAAILVERNG
jgi:hypothetical protein